MRNWIPEVAEEAVAWVPVLLFVLFATLASVMDGLLADLDQVSASEFQAEATKFAAAVVESPFSGNVTVIVLYVAPNPSSTVCVSAYALISKTLPKQPVPAVADSADPVDPPIPEIVIAETVNESSPAVVLALKAETGVTVIAESQAAAVTTPWPNSTAFPVPIVIVPARVELNPITATMIPAPMKPAGFFL